MVALADQTVRQQEEPDEHPGYITLLWLTAALACCFSQTVIAQDVPGKRLGDYCRAHPEIGLITATDKLFEKK